MSPARQGRTAQGWSNWAGTATAQPSRQVRAHDMAEAAREIAAATDRGQQVRPLGSGHSFSGIGAPQPVDGTSAIALDLSGWTGVVHADTQSGLVTVRSGTPLHQLNPELDALGLAMPNLGDIDRQTIAGAISTGTHGTGSGFGGLATQVESMELVLADGSTMRCSATENPELFGAARVGLGALGIISTITLRCVPAFALAADEHPEPLDSVLERFDELADGNDHFEFYWFPYGSKTLVKRNNRLQVGAATTPLHPLRSFLEYEVLENKAFGALCRLGRSLPSVVPRLSRFCGSTWSSRSYSDSSHRVFVTGRSVRFVETEYAVPRESLVDVLTELRKVVGTLTDPVMFPIEVRVAAADDVWMSTAYQRDSAYIAVHQFAGMPYREWFDRFEAVVDAAAGRPHWGKMHQLGADTLRERYPRFDDFLRIRSELDPGGVFRNPYLDRVLDG